MVEMGFLCFLAALLVLTVMFQEPTKSPEQLASSFPGYEYADTQYVSSKTFTTIVPEYEYADPQYRGDNSLGLAPNLSLLEDNAEFPAESDYIPSDYDEIYVPEEHILVEPTGPLATEMDNLHQDDEDFTLSSEELEFDTTPIVQVDINTTVTNDTAATHVKDIPLSTAITPIPFATVMLAIFSAALFITTMLIMWNSRLYIRLL